MIFVKFQVGNEFVPNNFYLCQTAVKKVFAFILALLYFATTIGATVHLHYCMGRLVEVGLHQRTSEACSECGMLISQSGNDCCKEKQQQVKIEKEHQKADVDYQPLVPIAPAASFAVLPAVALASLAEKHPTGHAPPRSTAPAIYKRNCVFRI